MGFFYLLLHDRLKKRTGGGYYENIRFNSYD